MTDPDTLARYIIGEFNTTAAFCSVADQLELRIAKALRAYADEKVAEEKLARAGRAEPYPWADRPGGPPERGDAFDMPDEESKP